MSAQDIPQRTLKCGAYRLALDRPLLMGIVNVTPDSFSDGGRFTNLSHVLDHGFRLAEEGADILDVGGESSRPGATQVNIEEELRRVLPVIKELIKTGVPISVDTVKPQVMQAALDAGASIINDITALGTNGSIKAIVQSDAAVVLMHMQGEPRSMQQAPYYGDVVEEVRNFLFQRASFALNAGISQDRLVLDPGFGFGKTLEHNLQLLRQLNKISSLDLPVLVGLSRKSMIGSLTGQPVDGRLPGSLAAALAAVANGAGIIRVHDVAATRDALSVWCAITQIKPYS